MQRSDDDARGILAELQSAGRIACRSGCSACCNLDVSAGFAELARLAEHVAATFEPAGLSRLMERLDERCSELEALQGAMRAAGSRACVLLEDERCSAYEARPLACRGWNSADDAACRDAMAAPHAPPSIPVNPQLRTGALEIARGLADAARDAGLDEAPLDLPHGLRMLLTAPDAATEAWLQGRVLHVSVKTPMPPGREQDADGIWHFRAESEERGESG